MKLIVLRGNSGSGKSTVARELRRMLGDGIALVEQDYLARTVLGQQKTDAGGNQDLVALVTEHLLARADAVVLEGMLSNARYAEMLQQLASAPGVTAWFYYFDIPFDETVARHATRDKAGSFGAEELRQWYVENDLLPFVQERRITAQSSAAETAARIIADAGLAPGTSLG